MSSRPKLDHFQKAARRRLIEAEGREKAAAERREVSAGVAERVELGEDRGEAFDVPTGREATHKPVRVRRGLPVLWDMGKVSSASLAAGVAYGVAWRTFNGESGLRSQLGDHDRGGGDGPTLERLANNATARLRAGERLALMRHVVGAQPDLVRALDLICGQELTPREAGGNGLNAAVYTALVVVALDLLAQANGVEAQRKRMAA